MSATKAELEGLAGRTWQRARRGLDPLAARLARFAGLALLAGILIIPSLSQAHATPLDDSACLKFMGEFIALKKSRIELDMAPGPENARTRLSAERLTQVKRYLDIDGILMFRCPQYSMTGPGAPHNLPVRNPKPQRSAEAVTVVKKADRSGAPPLPQRKPAKP